MSEYLKVVGMNSGPLVLKLVSMEEKKDFLAMYMAHRMEVLSKGIELKDKGRDDQLSRFWNEPDENYLLWIMEGNRRLGFTAISVKDIEQATILDLGLFKDQRGKGFGKMALGEICRFAKYRGLKNISVEFVNAPQQVIQFFTSQGFISDGNVLSREL